MPSTTMAPNTSFPFLDLPAELRVRIYHFTLDYMLPQVIDGSKGAEPTSLLQTSKIIRTELNAELLKRLETQDSELRQELDALSAALEAHEADLVSYGGSQGLVLLQVLCGLPVDQRAHKLEMEIDDVHWKLKNVRVLIRRCEKRIPVS